MDLMHDAGSDLAADESDGAPAPGGRSRAPGPSRRLRRRLAAGLAVAAIVLGIGWFARGHSAGDGDGKTQPVDASGSVTENTAKPPTTGPGGVGTAPAKTGLPAIPASGGRVRTGTREQGCFSSMREYLDAWDRTGQEPDPCFTSQDAADQPQPDGVVRSYNGEKF